MFHKTRISQNSRAKVRAPVDADGDGVVGFWDCIGFYWYSFKNAIGWYTHRTRVQFFIACFIWLCVGTAYGQVLEKWSLLNSLYFALSAVSTAGLQTPTCDGPSSTECTLTLGRSMWLGMYILIGVPLYACTMGQFAGVVVDHAVRAKEREKMLEPIEASDFVYASKLLSNQHSTTLQLGNVFYKE